MSQFWHIFVCKTRRVSIFRHRGLYTNRHTFYGVAIAVAVMLVCAYIPWLQDNIFYSGARRVKLLGANCGRAECVSRTPILARAPPSLATSPSGTPPGLAAWVPHLFFLAYILAYTEGTKKIAREHPNGFVARWLCW